MGLPPVGHPRLPSLQRKGDASEGLGADQRATPRGHRRTDDGFRRSRSRSVYPPRVERVREVIYWTLEESDSGSEVSQAVTLSTAAVLVATIVLSLVCSVLETMPRFDSTPKSVWRIIELLTTAVFTLEYLLRLWACDVLGTSAIAWALRAINVCDLLSIIPVYADILVGSSGIKWLRVLRVMRLFKLGRYSPGARVMLTALSNSMSALYNLFFLILIGTVFFASAVYYTEKLACPTFYKSNPDGLERFRSYSEACEGGDAGSFGTCCWYYCRGLPSAPPHPYSLCAYPVGPAINANDTSDWEVHPAHELLFNSIPQAMWWACVTITTVGYGDLIPTYWVSRLIACFAMVSGLLMIAMPFAIVAAKLSEAMTLYADPDEVGGRPRVVCMEEERAASNLAELRADVRHSLQLKREILRLQELRDNLWTSVEHAMASLAYEGLVSLGTNALEEMPHKPGRVVVTPQESCEWSVFVFGKHHFIRRWAIRLTRWVVFDWVVILAILLNSCILMSQDYYPHEPGEEPWENRLQASTDPLFIIFFTLECAVKIIAQGFILSRGAYLRDAWNWVDFAVVVSGLASLVLPGGGSLAIIRTIRVLRPLRTFSAMPGLRNLFNTILLSLPGLRDVVLMALFLMVTFGILGLHLFGGVMNRHCRLTPQPLHFTQHARLGGCRGSCFDANGSTAVQSTAVYEAFCQPMAKCHAAYLAGRDYYVWPVDPSQADRFCHEYVCRSSASLLELPGASVLGPEVLVAQFLAPLNIAADGHGGFATTCGSELDSDPCYAPRLANASLDGVTLDDYRDASSTQSFNWGYTNYNNFVFALFVVFQSITLEGWTDVMYMLQDASSNFLGFIYFGLLVIIGAFFLLNIVLAIVWDAFMDIKEAEERAGGQEEAQQGPQTSGGDPQGGGAEPQAAVAPPAPGTCGEPRPRKEGEEGRRGRQWLPRGVLPELGAGLVALARSSVSALFLHRNAADPEKILREPHRWRAVRWARAVARNEVFQALMIMVITMNVVVLSMDQYPKSLWPANVALNFSMTFNVIFFVEFVILNVAVLPLTYWGDNALAFDGVIVLTSVAEYISEMILPGPQGGSGVTAMRAFRLLRIFKLAKKFRSMKLLMKASLETLLGMRDFVFLLFLIMCIFALIGQSFFGGKFMFDDDGNLVTWHTVAEFKEKCPVDGHRPRCVPRANFDTWLWSFTTIFQILTGENWNTVMYDGMRATDWHMFLFFWVVMIFGNFVILNLFLAYLMYNFEAKQNMIADVAKEKPSEGEKPTWAKVTAVVEVIKSRSAIFRESTFINAMLPSFTPASESDDLEAKEHRAMRASTHSPPRATVGQTGEGRRALTAEELVGKLFRPPIRAPIEEGLLGQRRDTAHPSPRSTFRSGGFRLDQVVPEERFVPREGGRAAQSAEFLPDFVASKQGTSAAAGDFPCASQAFAENQPVGELDQDQAEDDAQKDGSGTRTGAEKKMAQMGSDVPSIEGFLPRAVTKADLWSVLRQRSCFLFTELCPLRRFALRVVADPRFDQVVILLITFSSLLMMFQNPLNDPDGWLEQGCAAANLTFTILFAAEMFIKMMAFGVFCGNEDRPAYLQNSWHILDCSIVVISVADAFEKLVVPQDSGALAFMKIFRIARMLRPLRIISRNENLKVVVKTIGASLPQLRILLVFSLIFFLIFALLGVSMFKGSFYTCRGLGPDGGLGDQGFNTTLGTSGTTPLCIPPVAVASYGLQFVRQRGDAGCDAGWQEWQRGMTDTPICEVHCDGACAQNHPFCMNTRPWGYHAMRCSDCREAFCPGARDEGCRRACEEGTGNVYFCLDRTHGSFSTCVDECEAECACHDACHGLVEDAALCVEQAGRWVNNHQHFDTLVEGMVSLFEICTTEGWVDLMLAGVDSVGPYRQPRRDEKEWMACIMFICFIMLGSFFVLNLCVGVIIDNYGKERDARGKLMITAAQAEWIAFQKALYVKKQFFLQTNLHELSPTRAHLIRIVTSVAFEKIIMACIVVNTICLAMVQYPSPSKTYDQALDSMTVFFAVVFNMEAALKLGAMHRNYFLENWNVFDFMCVFVGDAFLVYDAVADVGNTELRTVMSTIRVFRIARLFRLVRFLKGLNQLFFAFVLSLPKLVNVAAIMLLLIYLYAVLGINLFAQVVFPVGGTYNHNANFRTFPQAMSLLIRAMTGEAWNELMHDLSYSKFDLQSFMDIPCEDSLDLAYVARLANVTKIDQKAAYFFGGPTWEPNACGTNIAFVYFITYTIVVTFVILNLFIAVIFEGFEESSKSEMADVINSCVDVWKRYDPDNRMLIPLDRAFEFIDEAVEGLCKQFGKTRDPNFAMEPRWDPSYTGADVQESFLALYNLRYIRMLGLTVTPERQVRFVAASKAVIRRVICQGGLRSYSTTPGEGLARLRDLEALERGMDRMPIGVDKELAKLLRMEQKQARVIRHTISHGSLFRMSSRFSAGSRSSRSPSGSSAPEVQERRLVEDVAAAKLGLYLREARQRRKAKEAARAPTSCTRPGTASGGSRPGSQLRNRAGRLGDAADGSPGRRGGDVGSSSMPETAQFAV